jgi:ribosome-associated heat shock protein Hsp15
LSANDNTAPARSSRRLDQWLWFARFVKSRSLAGRLCASGVVAVNGVSVGKANHAVKPGDIVVVTQRGWEHTVRVVALGDRRGPSTEARTLFEEIEAARHTDSPVWEPLLFADDGGE